MHHFLLAGIKRAPSALACPAHRECGLGFTFEGLQFMVYDLWLVVYGHTYELSLRHTISLSLFLLFSLSLYVKFRVEGDGGGHDRETPRQA